ncbi:MAG: PhnD/SsuA/transferrin family substrate-binding protein, partial [Gammaproteobacteria bacterium]|nr:PhnD/SsuA/transferrin family substrate-binding protein [Gammaproteobacteria bacterium]
MKIFSLALMLWLFSAEILSAERYTFGVVPQFAPSKLHEIWYPILKELEQRTGYQLQMVGTTNIPAFEEGFISGEYDFAYMNPYHATVAMSKKGYRTLVRDQGRRLSGILVVRKESPLQKVSQLQGKRVAFPAPNALGASLLMRADIDQLYQTKIDPIYVQTHSSVYLHVLMGNTDAGGGVLATLRRQPQEIQDQLKIIYRTREMAPHPIMVHPRVSSTVAEAVQQALLEMGNSVEGAKLLARIP